MLNLDRTIALARERGLSNTYLAKKLGRSSASLFVDWRKGKSKPSENDIQVLAQILGTSYEYLTDRTDEIVPKENRRLEDVYLHFAKDAQDNGIDPEDIRMAIEAIKIARGQKK